MSHYNVAQLRAHLSEALDSAASGETVIVERRGEQFVLQKKPAVKDAATPRPFVAVDRELMENGWSWDWDGPGESPGLRVAATKAKANAKAKDGRRG